MPHAAPRRWLSFSLARMLIAFTLFGGVLAVGRWWFVRIYEQDAAVWELQQLNCSVHSSGYEYLQADPQRKSVADISTLKQLQAEWGRVVERVTVMVPCKSDEQAERVRSLIHRLPYVRSVEIYTPYHKDDAKISAAEGKHTAIILRDLHVNKLSLAGKQRSGDAAAAIVQTTDLAELNVAAMSLTTDELRRIVTKKSMRSLVLGPESVSADSLSLLAATAHLETLSLIDPPTADLARLAAHPGLRIKIKFRNGTDDDVRAAAGLPNLVFLNLWDCSVTDEGVATLRRTESLEELYLAYLTITDRSLESVVDLPRLQSLYLVGSDVTEMGVIAAAKRRPKLRFHVSDTLDGSTIWSASPGALVSCEPPQKIILERKAEREKAAVERALEADSP